MQIPKLLLAGMTVILVQLTDLLMTTNINPKATDYVDWNIK